MEAAGAHIRPKPSAGATINKSSACRRKQANKVMQTDAGCAAAADHPIRYADEVRSLSSVEFV